MIETGHPQASPSEQTKAAPHHFPKTDVRYWREKLFQRSNDEWHCRIGFGSRQDRWPLRTTNREDAAAKAKEIWLSLQKDGFEATERKFKPWTVAPPQASEHTLTIGEFIKAVKAVAVVRPTTFTHYERKFRFLVSQIACIRGTKCRHDYVNGGAAKWRAQVDDYPLVELTPQKISEWRVRYLSRFDKQPLNRQRAQQTVASILRNAKTLFSPNIIRNLGIKVPSPLPFDGVEIGKRPRTRYKSTINAPLLASLAYKELKEDRPELFKIFLLAFGAGLRRGEIDRLTWKQFDWQKGTISIETNEWGANKTEASDEEIDIGEDLLIHFKAGMTTSETEFVISSKSATLAAPHWNRYRAEGHFKALLEWLRSKGVTARNPLHTLRKEFGSLINQQFGIYAASAALRHSNISITRDTYIGKKERTALDISALMAKEAAATSLVASPSSID